MKKEETVTEMVDKQTIENDIRENFETLTRGITDDKLDEILSNKDRSCGKEFYGRKPFDPFASRMAMVFGFSIDDKIKELIDRAIKTADPPEHVIWIDTEMAIERTNTSNGKKK